MDELGVQLVGPLQEALPGLGVDQGQDKMEITTSELDGSRAFIIHTFTWQLNFMCVISHHL